MRRSFATKKIARKMRKPAELMLVPMIDIFTVLVTFLLMTAVFSKTVVLELNLPETRQGEVSGKDGRHDPARDRHALRHPGAGDGPGARVRGQAGTDDRAGGAVPRYFDR